MTGTRATATAPTSAAAPRAIVFAYHNVGVRCLSVLLAHGVDVACVVTHHDNPQETIWFESVAALAARHGIPFIMPDDPNDATVVAELAALAPDFLFSFYYRLMLKPALLAVPRKGAYNMHGSLLPKYRGRVPVNWAIIYGEHETGATLHEMVAKPDAGRIVAQQAVPILPDDTAADVFSKVTVAAEIALNAVLPALLSGTAQHRPQDLAAGSYYGGRKAEDGRIDWTLSAAELHNLIRAVAPPYPGAYCDLPQGRLHVFASLRGTANYPGHTGTGRPALHAIHGQLFAECGDGERLQLLAVEFNGSAITGPWSDALIAATFGTSSLVPS